MDTFLKLPVFVINLKRCTNRLETVLPRIAAAGFTDVRIWTGVDAKEPGALETAWAVHGSPPFDRSDTEFCETHKGKQGCFLSWVHLFKHVIDHNIPRFIGFEDDVLFHSQWANLAPVYIDYSPTDYDILYLGGQIETSLQNRETHQIGQFPVFCTNALVITLEGAKKLYNLLIKCPTGVRTIDCMFIDAQKQMISAHNTDLFKWYVWNAHMFPDEKGTKMNPGWAKRNNGLVFQDDAFISDVRVW